MSIPSRSLALLTLIGTLALAPAAGASTTTQAFTTPGASALSLTALTLSPSRFRLGARPAAKGRRGRAGTTIAFTLSRRARVTISFERRVGSRFVRVRGALRVSGRAGRTQVAFAGAVARRKLTPGRYRVSVVAAAGGRASKVRRARATVLR